MAGGDSETVESLQPLLRAGYYSLNGLDLTSKKPSQFFQEEELLAGLSQHTGPAFVTATSIPVFMFVT
ncbi:hypothetical protein EPH_0065340 [Eimeria praecox]|uniref:Uncharacterized protein n=1 Tax=Eimeria praecox TaxID=51316 RepID=U6H362_9EIME|nr:hypothetical protein EPH_0065340 [Eimeria praecox]